MVLPFEIPVIYYPIIICLALTVPILIAILASIYCRCCKKRKEVVSRNNNVYTTHAQLVYQGGGYGKLGLIPRGVYNNATTPVTHLTTNITPHMAQLPGNTANPFYLGVGHPYSRSLRAGPSVKRISSPITAMGSYEELRLKQSDLGNLKRAGSQIKNSNETGKKEADYSIVEPIPDYEVVEYLDSMAIDKPPPTPPPRLATASPYDSKVLPAASSASNKNLPSGSADKSRHVNVTNSSKGQERRLLSPFRGISKLSAVSTVVSKGEPVENDEEVSIYELRYPKFIPTEATPSHKSGLSNKLN